MGRLGSGLPVSGHVLGDAVVESDEAAMVMAMELEVALAGKVLGTNAEAAGKDATIQMDEMNFMVQQRNQLFSFTCSVL